MIQVSLLRKSFRNFTNFLFLVGLSCTPNKKGVAETELYVLEKKYGRNLVDKEANKAVETIEAGDTFEVLESRRESQTDFYLYYKVRTANGKIGYLFERDSFTVIDR